ncbi:MAG TPA: hypothetical protein VE631_01770 [Alphaproteobacteria bacterium]|nr:hypothetical protein [Alphaproteobacteria bacterium]
MKALARHDRRTMTDLIAEIDASRSVALSRAVRVYVLQRLQGERPATD